MHSEHRHWIDLVNLQPEWTTDDAMLRVIPEAEREFESVFEWPRLKALAYLNNNVSSLRLNWDRMEGGEAPDLDLINPVLETLPLRLVDPRRARGGGTHAALRVAARREGWNRGTAALRFVIQRATWHFARYVDWRLRDPLFPDATPGLFRVLACPHCRRLVPCPAGIPRACPGRCPAREETA